MAHHVEKKENYSKLYYLVGVIGGILTAFTIEVNLKYLVWGAIVGFLFAVFFYNLLIRGRADA